MKQRFSRKTGAAQVPGKGSLGNLVSVLAVILLAVAGVASAHHGTSGYDMVKVVTLDGTVTKYDWSNPHIIVYMDAKDDTGGVRHWSLELAAPLLMERLGWTKNSMKPGDHLVAGVHPSKNGAPVGLSGTATVLLKFNVNGKDLPHI